MPRKSLNKIEKKVSKKKKGLSGVHENSRDARRLQRGAARAVKLEAHAAARAKASQPLLQRIAVFQDEAKALNGPADAEQIHSIIQAFLGREDAELAEIQSERRPGRPASAQEERIKQRMDREDKEYDSGFWVPDLRDLATLERLQEWTGDWGFLNTMKYLRLARSGSLEQASFPPKGIS